VVADDRLAFLNIDIHGATPRTATSAAERQIPSTAVKGTRYCDRREFSASEEGTAIVAAACSYEMQNIRSMLEIPS
jgi:acetylglutamate kinase